MQRSLLLLMMSVVLLGLSASAQEDEAHETTETADATVEAEPAAEAAPAPEQEPVVEDVYYRDIDDKDFRPSEEIPADQSIPFPSDI